MEAKDITKDMKKKVSNWSNVAKNHKLSKSEIERMESAFKI